MDFWQINLQAISYTELIPSNIYDSSTQRWSSSGTVSIRVQAMKGIRDHLSPSTVLPGKLDTSELWGAMWTLT